MKSRVFFASVLSVGVFAGGCVEQRENGGSYAGVDDTSEFKDIAAELMRLSADPQKTQFSCQNKDGSKGVLLERADVDHQAHYFERQNGLLVELDAQPVRAITERDNPGPIYFTGLQLNNKGFPTYDNRYGFWMRIDRDTPLAGTSFIRSELRVDRPSVVVHVPEFFCLPVDVRGQDELNMFSLSPDADGNKPGVIYELRGQDAQDLYFMLRNAGATESEVKDRLPEPLPGVISRGGVTCTSKVYSEGIGPTHLIDAFSCAFLMDPSVKQTIPTGQQWNPLIGVVGYGEGTQRIEILPESQFRNNAQGYLYQNLIRHRSVGDDVVTRLNPGDSKLMKLRIKGVSMLFTFGDFMYAYKYAGLAKSYPAIDARGSYLELRPASNQLACRKFETSEDNANNMNYECDFAIDSNGLLQTIP